MQLRTLWVLSSLFALSCGEAGKDGASSGASAGASGAAKPAGAGSKTCPEGGSFCLDLPAGFTAEPPKALKVGGTMDIEGPRRQTATLFWGPLEQLPSRQSTMESGNKGKDSVKETLSRWEGLVLPSGRREQGALVAVARDDGHRGRPVLGSTTHRQRERGSEGALPECPTQVSAAR